MSQKVGYEVDTHEGKEPSGQFVSGRHLPPSWLITSWGRKKPRTDDYTTIIL